MGLTIGKLRLIPAISALAVTSCGGGYGGGSSMPPPAPTISLSAQPTTVVAGQSTTITWSAMNASSCTASGAWSGSEPVSGQMMVSPTTVGANTYTLSCTNVGAGPYGGMNASSSMSVTVTATAATAFVRKDLVADAASGSVTVDTNLVNPWGIVFRAGAPVWIANNHSQTSTLYDGNGTPQPAGTPLTVNLPSSTGGVAFDPTGIVGNATTDFVVSAAGKSAAALFIYSGEGGMIAGWSKDVDVTHAVAMYTDAGGAVYKGLALANNGSGNFLYATDFHNNKVDVFDAHLYQADLHRHELYVQGSRPAGRLRAVRHPGAQDRSRRRGADLRDLRHAEGARQSRRHQRRRARHRRHLRRQRQVREDLDRRPAARSMHRGAWHWRRPISAR